MAVADIDWTCPLYPSSGTIAIGDILCKSSDGLTYVKATTANRGTQRSYAVALSAADSVIVVVVMAQTTGVCVNGVTGLGAGAASYVRVSALGRCERVGSIGASDDYIGWCEANGDLHLTFGLVPSTSPPFTAPTGTGAMLTLAGSMVAAALAPGANGNVMTSNGTQWTSAAAPVSFTAGGDLSGTNTVQSVDKVHGATVPAAGALTTGNGLYVTGVSALSYSALNLAGGANYVTGLLPQTNLASLAVGAIKSNGTVLQSAGLGTTLQVLRTNAGVTDVEWATISGATITGSAGQVVTSDGAGNGAGQTNVKAGSGFISIGATVPSSGSLRLGNATASIIFASDGAGGKVAIAAVDNSANLVIGGDDGGTAYQVNDTYIYSGNRIIFAPTGATRLRINSGSTENAKPIIGLSSPYSVHGRATIALVGDYALASSEYIHDTWKFTGAMTTTNWVVTVPAAGSEPGTYKKVAQIDMTTSSTANGITLTTGAGTTVSLGGAASGGALKFTAHIEVDPDGVRFTTSIV